ncbi:hypothetical protein IG631_13006 [Alternaria alternata]|nr:hypothetical protein IG631_13006 [Alternaria alternata]
MEWQGPNQSQNPRTQNSCSDGLGGEPRLRRDFDTKGDFWGSIKKPDVIVAVCPLLARSGCPTDSANRKGVNARSDCSQRTPWTLRSVGFFRRSLHIAGIYHTRSLKRQHWWWGILPLTDRLLAL